MKMAERLQELVIDDPDFVALDQERDVYCPFEAVGMLRQEVRHGSFLAHCLDPARPHGFGTEALTALLGAASKALARSSEPPPPDALSPIRAHLLDCGDATVQREWRPPVRSGANDRSSRTAEGRLDLLVTLPREKIVVAIELKIDAGEHGDQLRRYRDQVYREWPSQGWRKILLFVTKEGDSPTGREADHWCALALTELARAFDFLVARKVGAEPARQMLASYLAMLRRRIVVDDEAKDLATRLWSRHREALEFLMEQRPGGNVVMDLLYARRDEIARRMAQNGRNKVSCDHCVPGTLRFAVTGWDNIEGFKTAERWTSSKRLLLLEVAPDGDRNAIRARFQLGRGPRETRAAFVEAIERKIPNARRSGKLTDESTRLATQALVTGLLKDDRSAEEIVDAVMHKLDDYAKSTIPRFDAALASLQTVP